MFKDNPDVWHVLPVTKKGLMMSQLTKDACDRYNMVPQPPTPTTQMTRKNRTEQALVVSEQGQSSRPPTGSTCLAVPITSAFDACPC